MIFRFDHSKTRPETTRLLSMMDDGLIDVREVADMALRWLDEQSVKEMMQANDIATTSQVDEDEEDECDDEGDDERDE